MNARLIIEDDGEGWTFIRKSEFCPLCRGPKPLGKIVCTACWTTRTFLSMTTQLLATERSLAWKAERNPDRPVTPRATDPRLTPCPKCTSSDLTFTRYEAAGGNAGERYRLIINYYVLCRSCGCRTLPRTSKKFAAKVWEWGGRHVFVAQDAGTAPDPSA